MANYEKGTTNNEDSKQGTDGTLTEESVLK
jgi:hypothetical protein